MWRCRVQSADPHRSGDRRPMPGSAAGREAGRPAYVPDHRVLHYQGRSRYVQRIRSEYPTLIQTGIPAFLHKSLLLHFFKLTLRRWGRLPCSTFSFSNLDLDKVSSLLLSSRENIFPRLVPFGNILRIRIHKTVRNCYIWKQSGKSFLAQNLIVNF